MCTWHDSDFWPERTPQVWWVVGDQHHDLLAPFLSDHGAYYIDACGTLSPEASYGAWGLYRYRFRVYHINTYRKATAADEQLCCVGDGARLAQSLNFAPP
ncbi:MAG: hypothetical protein AAF581_10330 [Planctomycetota bacterium]